MTYVIGEECVDVMDRTCVSECPVDCIYEGARSLYIHPVECIDCGACEATCPVKAIAYEDDLPPEKAERIVERSRQWVELHGASGGAKRLGPVGVDHPDIAGLPTG
jgi:ferredoxin